MLSNKQLPLWGQWHSSLLPERFWSKVEIGEGGCWRWTGDNKNGGYGMFAFDGRKQFAHRVAYKVLQGPIGDGLVIDHLCRVPCCVNPSHLEVVTHKVNILRGVGVTALNAVKTHCPKGHEYSIENTGHYNGWRYCILCQRAHGRLRPSPTQRARMKASEAKDARD